LWCHEPIIVKQARRPGDKKRDLPECRGQIRWKKSHQCQDSIPVKLYLTRLIKIIKEYSVERTKKEEVSVQCQVCDFQPKISPDFEIRLFAGFNFNLKSSKIEGLVLVL
jgi:hypothetical protein